MKKRYKSVLTLFLFTAMGVMAQTGGMGIGTNNPQNSAALEVSSNTKGLLPPRMNNAQMTAIAMPATGLLVYCTDCSPVGLHVYDGVAWTALNAGQKVLANCSGFAGNYTAGFALSGATFTVAITNTTFSSVTMAFAASNLVLSGVSGVTVGTPSLTPNSTTITPGATLLVSYPITGTPTSTGVLTGTWSNFLLNCSATQSVSGLSAVLNDANYCTNATLNGNYLSNVAFTAANTFTVTITNNSGSTINTMPAPATSNLALTWTGTGTLSVASVAPTGTYNLANGATRTFTYTLSGTPTSVGTLTANWTYNDLTCQKMRNNLGDATFTLPQSKYVFSTLDGTVDTQDYITNTALNQIIVNVPYTGGTGSYSAYSGTVVTGAAGEGGDINGFSISYPAGAFATSGTIPVTVTVDGDGTYSAKKQLFGVQQTIVTLPFFVNGVNRGNIVLKVIGGIKDKVFKQTVNGENNHNFVYLPITAADGKIWLNNNLGAHYANVDHPSFNLAQQATSATDHLAYGSLFQWGRKPDGHELVTWTNDTTGAPVNGTTTTLADSPANPLFIITLNTNDWRITQDDLLWATEASINNPCPAGYRVPTIAEFTALVSASSITNSATAASAVLKLPAAIFRSYANGLINDINSSYWSSSAYNSNALVLYITIDNTNTASFTTRGNGFPVRCIKD